MRIGLISDIHSNIYALRSVLKRLNNVDFILCAGDIIGYYPFVNEVFVELESHKVIFVKGNHDAYLCGEKLNDLGPIEDKSVEYTKKYITDTNLNRLKNAPLMQGLEINGIKINMFHASPWDKLEEYIYPDYSHFDRFSELDADVIILGHTHYPMIKQVGNKIIINPGSCGQPRDHEPRASLAILNTSTKEVKIERVEYDIESVCNAVKRLGFDNRLSVILKRSR